MPTNDNPMMKCQLGCGRVDAEIGQCGSFLTCGSGVATPVVPGRDVILTVVETGMVRCVDPLAVLTGTSKHHPIPHLNEFAEVTAKVLPREAPVERPVFTPHAGVAKQVKHSKAGKATSAVQAEPSGGDQA